MPTPFPKNEAERIEELRRYRILDTPPEEPFDRIAGLAAKVFDVPIALVSLIDCDRQWFKARTGLDVPETGRELAFCAYTILGDDVMVVEDAARDPRFEANDHVLGAPHIRFYAGAPLRTPGGFNLGSLCVIDTQPRQPTAAQLDVLRTLADVVVDEIGRRLEAASDLHHAEHAHREERWLRSEYEALLDSIEGIVWRAEVGSFQFSYVSKKAEGLLGYPLAAWTEDPDFWVKHLHPEDRDEVVSTCMAATKAGQNHTFDYRMIRADGGTVWLRDSVTLLEKEGHAPTLYGVMIDITDQKEIELALERKTGFLEAVLDNLGAGVVACDENGALNLFNQVSRRFHGLDEQPIPPAQWAEHYNLFCADGKTLLELEEVPLFRALKGELVRDAEIAIIPKDGERRYVLVNGQPLLGSNGQFGAVAVMHDYTERREADAALRQSEAQLARAQSIAHLGSWEWDVPTGTLRWSDEMYRIYGLAPGQPITYEAFIERLHPDELERVTGIIQHALETHESFSYYHRINRAGDGAERILHGEGEVIVEGGQVVRMVGTGQDVTEQRLTEQELRESEQRLAEAQAMARMGSWEIDLVTRRIAWSDEMYLLFGMTPGGPPPEAIQFWQWVHPADRRRLRYALDRAALDGVADVCDYRIALPGAPVRHVQSRVQPLPDVAGRMVKLRGTLLDVTERKLTEVALEEARRVSEAARQAAEAADHAKSAFLANMSHEIRTPMNGVVGMTEVLLETPLTTAQRDAVAVIRSSSDALLALINDILDFSKIEAGQVVLEKQPFDLRACVEGTLEVLSIRADEKQLELLCDIDPALPTEVLGDEVRLRQVLLNLVSNAVKFTSEGHVLVSVEGRQRQGGGMEVVFSVKDTGPGISAEDQERLFQRFIQLDESTTRRYGGTGLGLALSRRLVELMGGRIWIESEVGHGATFSFSVATEVVHRAPGAVAAAGEVLFRGRRLLVVDDRPDSQRILVRQASAWGMTVVAVATTSAALAVVQEAEPFDAAVVRSDLKAGDGMALAGMLQRVPAGARLPLVMLCPFAVCERVSAPASAHLFSARLPRPLKMSALRDALLRMLRGGISPVPPSESTAQAGMGHALPLRLLLVEDNPVNQVVMGRMLDRLGYRADLATDGAAALETLAGADYDVVFMDVQMSEVDGVECMERIRTEGGRQAWIIGFTANALVGDHERFLAAGMDDYLVKPVKLDQLTEALRKAARQHGLQHSAKR